MPGDCPASLHILLFVCGKHSAPSRTPFRYQAKTVRLAIGIGVQLQTGISSASQRNGVQLQTGIAFTFDRIPQQGLLTVSGRLANVFGPLLVAFLFTHHGYASVFVYIATCWVLVAIIIGGFGPLTKRED